MLERWRLKGVTLLCNTHSACVKMQSLYEINKKVSPLAKVIIWLNVLYPFIIPPYIYSNNLLLLILCTFVNIDFIWLVISNNIINELLIKICLMKFIANYITFTISSMLPILCSCIIIVVRCVNTKCWNRVNNLPLYDPSINDTVSWVLIEYSLEHNQTYKIACITSYSIFAILLETFNRDTAKPFYVIFLQRTKPGLMLPNVDRLFYSFVLFLHKNNMTKYHALYIPSY